MAQESTEASEGTAGVAGSDLAAAEHLAETYRGLQDQLARQIVGQTEVIEQLAMCVLARGHGLLVGVPGLAKTLLVSTLAESMSLIFRRIQFTPDLMPSDILGTELIQDDRRTGERRFKFVRGPIFGNVILADEINRAPPKTQAALLEAMQERKVSIGGEDHLLDAPFFVLATQNPIEQEGTYPLPEAQLDRFLFEVRVGYPNQDEELAIMERMTGPAEQAVEPVLSKPNILRFQSLVRRVPVAQHVFLYAREIVRKSRPEDGAAPEFVKSWITWGAGPRASMNLILAGKARALLRGEFAVSWEDVDAVAKPVLRHRLVLNFAARSEGITADRIVEQLIECTPKTEPRQ